MENTIENLKNALLEQIKENSRLIAENVSLTHEAESLSLKLAKLLGVVEYLEDKIEQRKEGCGDCESFQPEEVEEW